MFKQLLPAAAVPSSQEIFHLETKAYKTDEKARGKRTISKLRAKVDPSHPNYMGEAWLSTPDGQAALR